MSPIEIGSLLLTAVNTLIVLWILIRRSAERRAPDVTAVYFTEIHDESGFVKKQKRVQIKGQLLLGEIPVGPPFLVSEQVTESVDPEKLRVLIDEVAKPLVQIGVRVAVRGLLK